jgi:transposase-like protein
MPWGAIEPMPINLQNLIDDAKCYETVRHLRWPEGVSCTQCDSKRIVKQGRDETESWRQRYQCKDCHLRFDDLSHTIFAGHHQPLRVWMLCLYLRLEA